MDSSCFLATSRGKMRISCYLIFFSFFFFGGPARSYALGNDALYTNCSRPFLCGNSSTSNLINTTYPFWGNGRPSYCGLAGFELECQDDMYTSMNFSGQQYRVVRITRNSTRDSLVMTVARDDLWNSPCLQDQYLANTSMDNNTRFGYAPGVKNLSIFYCSSPSPQLMELRNRIFCPLEGYPNRSALFIGDQDLNRTYKDNPEIRSCDPMIKVPVLESSLDDITRGYIDLHGALDTGFKLAYRVDQVCGECESSGGTCGNSLFSPHNFACYCPDKSQPYSCSGSGRSRKSLKVKVGVGIISVIGLAISAAIVFYLHGKLKSVLSMGQARDREIENLIAQHGPLNPQRFSYSQVERMTYSFREKLGQGGFGAVYKGKLRDDGTHVAVKILNNAIEGNEQEFLNEVASFSRTSHVNIVGLLGFCIERDKRALIYEFMPNGSLDRFINDDEAGAGVLGLDKLYSIALGVARGIEYLHQGCSTRILHFDIKPHNILLDDNFQPKISDFGLSKLCLNRESTVSMLAARGTIGYIAPEVFSRNFGDVSHKSDVYSYGKMLVEMVQGRTGSEAAADFSSEVNFHDQVYRLVEQGYGKSPYSHLTEEDKETARKMALVGVWCMQTDPKQRPSMRRVIEMLEGSAEALEIPPKPFLFSPVRTPLDSSPLSEPLI